MANEYNPFEWVQDLRRVVDDKLMADIVSDFRRSPPPPGPTLPTVRVQGAGTVVDGDTPHGGTGGWQESPQLSNWTPPGLREMDAMMDQQDAVDRAARIRELAEAAAVQRALESAEPKEREPKARGGKK
jgi:hypothetical protein